MIDQMLARGFLICSYHINASARGRLETMDKAQAAEIHKHLFAIREAINKTEEASSKLNMEDRAIFDDPLTNLWAALHAQALRAV